ncbi:MAG: hypothetical protein V4719_06980 [Planctomycetota bacterium]
MIINTTTKALQLIRELLSDPVDFENRGRGNELLQFYGDGISLDSLLPLLSHHHVSVRGTAMFVAAELGVRGRPLVDAIAPLVDDSDSHIAWDAMESIFLCTTDTFMERFVVVVKQLGNSSRPLRHLAMRLISKADLAQLLGARSRCEELGEDALVHAKCLQILIDSESGEGRNVREMLDSNIELVRLYGAIAANRLYRMHPELLEYAASNSNQDVGMFATEALDVK